MTSIDNVHKEDWIEIKHIGNMKPQHIGHIVQTTNFAFNTSGSICVFYKQTILEDFDTVHYFTFIDLVNKVCFESRIVYTQDYIEDEDARRVHGVYFCSENEFVFVNVFDGMVKQMVNEIDFATQSIKLQETIAHKFISRDIFELSAMFIFQPNKFVNFNGIDYILIIAEDSPIDSDPAWACSMYLVPMNPKDKDAPTKEFIFRFKPDNEITARIQEIVTPYNDLSGIANANYYASLDCLVRANKLCFNFCSLSVYTINERFRLVGVYGEIDLTKLRDISQEELRSKEELRLLFEEQEKAFQFIDAGDVDSTPYYYGFDFYHSDYNIGSVYMYRKKDNNNVHMTVINPMGTSKTSVMDCKIEEPLYGPSKKSNIFNRFTLHPHGALLHFKIENGSIRFRVLKNLKMNLKSLSLNKALFHKDTPIKNHLAYRLCFNRTKPIEYAIEKKMNLKRKRSH